MTAWIAHGPKLKALIEQTNLSDLLPPVPREMDLQQPVAPPEPAKPQPARSTNDALQVHFGGTDMVGKLANAPTSGRIKTFAMILLGGRPSCSACFCWAWSGPSLASQCSRWSTARSSQRC
ncbi:hypothetical protein B0X78_02005 [bacterium AM6]|nr:hypothetical protein B0X78_02005 [bacterium AM6]